MTYRVIPGRQKRFFSIPCVIAEKYLPDAKEMYIKTLLYLLCSDSEIFDTDVIASAVGTNPAVVKDALLYWAAEGIISLSEENGTAVALPASAVVSQENSLPPQEKKQMPPKAVVRYSPKDLSDKINSSDDLHQLTHDVQKILGRTINASETASLINLYEYYGFSAASALMICEYCHKLGKDRMAYIERVAKDWFERGIVTYADIEAEIIKQTEIGSFINKAAAAFGISGKLSKRQQEYIEQWRSMGFTTEMLEIAYDKCMDAKNELKFSYIDGILKNWAGMNISTPEQVSEEDRKFADGKAKRRNEPVKNKETSYDLGEWERFAMNFDPEGSGEK